MLANSSNRTHLAIFNDNGSRPNRFLSGPEEVPEIKVQEMSSRFGYPFSYCLALGILIFAVGCATTKGDFKVTDSPEKSAHVIGKVTITFNGKPPSSTWDGPCWIYFNGTSRSHAYRLDDSGEVFFSTSPGPFTIQKLQCNTGVSENSFDFYPEMPSSVLEDKSLNYIGDLTLDWKLGKTHFDAASLLPPNARSGFYRHGPIDLRADLNDATIQSFNQQHPEAKGMKLARRPIHLINVSKE